MDRQIKEFVNPAISMVAHCHCEYNGLMGDAVRELGFSTITLYLIATDNTEFSIKNPKPNTVSKTEIKRAKDFEVFQNTDDVYKARKIDATKKLMVLMGKLNDSVSCLAIVSVPGSRTLKIRCKSLIQKLSK